MAAEIRSPAPSLEPINGLQVFRLLGEVLQFPLGDCLSLSALADP